MVTAMNTIKINVNKQLDGYSFSITPSTRELIKKAFPQAQPANNIFVGYDSKSHFHHHVAMLEKQIYPALLGVSTEDYLQNAFEIQFIETQTGNVLHKLTPCVEKV